MSVRRLFFISFKPRGGEFSWRDPLMDLISSKFIEVEIFLRRFWSIIIWLFFIVGDLRPARSSSPSFCFEIRVSTVSIASILILRFLGLSLMIYIDKNLVSFGLTTSGLDVNLNDYSRSNCSESELGFVRISNDFC